MTVIVSIYLAAPPKLTNVLWLCMHQSGKAHVAQILAEMDYSLLQPTQVRSPYYEQTYAMGPSESDVLDCVHPRSRSQLSYGGKEADQLGARAAVVACILQAHNCTDQQNRVPPAPRSTLDDFMVCSASRCVSKYAVMGKSRLEVQVPNSRWLATLRFRASGLLPWCTTWSDAHT
jgi:hypothetical protein